jgi:RHS repeat-associated protein
VISGSGTTTPYYVHRDHLGSTNVLTAQDQSPIENITYYPFGGLKSDVKQGSFNERKKFTGHEYDQDTGLYYMQARYQSPTIGRFVSEDPAFWAVGTSKKNDNVTLGNPQRLNAYAYAGNNPVRNLDSDGRIGLCSMMDMWSSTK